MLPPGPRQPSVFQLVEFTRRPMEWLDECARRYGDPFTVRLPGLGRFVMAAAPELIREIFTGDTEVLQAGKANAILRPIVGPHSVLLLDGEPHLRQRRLLSPPLRGERMQAYAGLMAEATRAELERMPTDRAFSLHPHMQAITLEVILRAVFGLEEGARMDELRARLVEMLEPPPAILSLLPERYLDFPLSPFRTFLRRRAAVDAELREVVRTRRAAPGGGGIDILSLLLEQDMSDDELCDELITLLIAGHETTATALSWAFACILEHPEVEARLLDAPDDTEYLDAVIKETLRVRPVIPDVVREVQQPTRFAGFDIPAGVNLAPCIYLAHRRADAFPEPDRFLPERFIGAKIDPYRWFPFGGGVRRCLGMAFALYEMRVVIAEILARARLRLARPAPVRVVRRTITLAPEGGTRVRLQRR